MLSDREYRALARFRHTLRVFLRFSEEAARAHGLTPAQHELLLAIRGYDHEGRPSVTDVADALQLQLHSTTELVNRAVEAGLVTRTVDAQDRRRQRLGVTPRAEGLLAALSRDHRIELRRLRTELIDSLEALP
jgi:DNA-binding MarR family transcriptional regulator